MSSNKNAKLKLIELYGAECFIDKLHIRDTKGLTYTGKAQKEKMKRLTYHHIRPKSKGGRATVENRSFIIRRKSRMV